MNPRYPLVAERAAHRCEYCGAPEAIFNFPFELEHIIPFVRGGTDEFGNQALACRSCNVHKGIHIEGKDPDTQTAIRLFDPRQDRWEQHFQVDATVGVLVGRTPIGRATIGRLQMNASAQILARRQWTLVKIYPPET